MTSTDDVAGPTPEVGGCTDSGQDLAEYAILIGLIALVLIGVVTLLGQQLVTAFTNIAAQLPFAGGS